MKTITLMLALLSATAFGQGYQLLSVTPTGGGDTRYDMAGKINSNSWMFADSVRTLSNTVVMMQTIGGWTNTGVYRITGQVSTNMADIAALQAAMSNKVSPASLNAESNRINTVYGGLTTNLYFECQNLTNTLYFTNGVLRKVTQP